MKLFYLYYNQPEAIKNLEDQNYHKTGIETVIVDDGSKPALKCDWATVYRLKKDIPWNQPRANNFGFSKLDPKDIILRSDIDHWISSDDLEYLDSYEVRPKEILLFNRIIHRSDGTSYEKSPHNNIYLARVGDIIDAGGYDERFCGNYGYDDRELKHRLTKLGFTFKIHPTIKAHCNDWLGASGLNRDTTVNRALFEELTR